MDHAKARLGRLLLAGALAAPLAAAAADDIFLKLDGIMGESTDARHRSEIAILSYTQSVTGAVARATTGTGGGAGRSTCGSVTITKYVDLSSPDLILSALNGRHITKAVITFRRAGGTAPEYYKVTLDDVIVAEVEQNNARAGATEKVTLLARRFLYEYTATTPDGRPGGKPKAGWDCVAASKM